MPRSVRAPRFFVQKTPLLLCISPMDSTAPLCYAEEKRGKETLFPKNRNFFRETLLGFPLSGVYGIERKKEGSL